MTCGLCLQNYFMELIWFIGFDSFSDAADELMGGQVYDVVISVLTAVGTLWLIYAMWFCSRISAETGIFSRTMGIC